MQKLCTAKRGYLYSCKDISAILFYYICLIWQTAVAGELGARRALAPAPSQKMNEDIMNVNQEEPFTLVYKLPIRQISALRLKVLAG